MHIFVSMTSTLLAFVDGKVTLAELTAPETAFAFSCRRTHVLADPRRAPYEITWGTDPQVPYDCDLKVAVEELPLDRQQAWEQFRSAVAAADANQRVWWGVGRPDWDQENPFLDQVCISVPATVEALREQGHTVVHA